MTTPKDALPELPEPFYWRWDNSETGGHGFHPIQGHGNPAWAHLYRWSAVFSADQMQAYATEAVRAALAAMASKPAESFKAGNEFAPFHPDASHVSPDYRDGWNHCFQAALASRQEPAGAVPEGFSVVKLSQCAYRTKRGAIYGGTTCDAGTTPLFEILEVRDMAAAPQPAEREPMSDEQQRIVACMDLWAEAVGLPTYSKLAGTGNAAGQEAKG